MVERKWTEIIIQYENGQHVRIDRRWIEELAELDMVMRAIRRVKELASMLK